MPPDIGPTSDNKILHSIMSSSSRTASNTQSINVDSGDCPVHSNGSSYTANMTHVTYCCSQAMSDSIGSLIDGGAHSGLAGADVHMLDYTEQYADSMGVGQASINTLPCVTCGGTNTWLEDTTVLGSHLTISWSILLLGSHSTGYESTLGY